MLQPWLIVLAPVVLVAWGMWTTQLARRRLMKASAALLEVAQYGKAGKSAVQTPGTIG